MIIPALDLFDGTIIRLKQGDYHKQQLYKDTPLEKIKAYAAAGAPFIHLVDLSGAKSPQNRQINLLRNLLEHSPVPLQIGGGIRHKHEIKNLLQAGAARVVVGSLAISAMEEVKRWWNEFGHERLVLAVDIRQTAKGENKIAIHGWQDATQIHLETVIEAYLAHGLHHVLCTDIKRDGMLNGPNLALYQKLHRCYPSLKIQASGGVATLSDISQLRRSGVDSAIIGRSLLDGHYTYEEAIQCWQNG
ncbi:1-(5-phosphoribosyl)-5-[(5-phosphoribosylamino)methylideneamino]imidazole-4-carboxamide isomerase [Bartonella sp. DGB2]|uniref:1-(5-phosphoribosyl)-5-[(5- phosphoribosylamino)methylideneamino]imidazole-4- carboxamide isomerase n=1 Tax=Bartonella sp. DGB2 TaxID=3388426 RepID=UPI00398FC716